MSLIHNVNVFQTGKKVMTQRFSAFDGIVHSLSARTTLAALAVLALATCVARPASAASLTWSLGTGGNWNTTDLNWNSGTTAFTNGAVDSVTFNNSAGGTINVVGNMEPLSTTVSAAAGTYTFSGGNIVGSGGLTKSGAGTLAIGSNYAGLTYTGTTQIDGGVLQIAHNSGGGDPSNRSLGGQVTLNGGTLRFQHTGAGHFNPALTFTNLIQVTSLGGTIDFNGAANSFTNTLGPMLLGGTLNVTGNTGSPNGVGASYNFTGGNITLNANSQITNSTTTAANGPHQIVLSPNIGGTTHNLTLEKSGTGGGFQILNIDNTTNGLNVKNLISNANLVLSTTTGADPLDLIQANGGVLTMGNGATLSIIGRPTGGTSTGTQIIDPSAIVWQGNNTLTLQRQTGGNQDSQWTLANNLTVSSASGLTTLNYGPYRSGNLNSSGASALIVGNGGLLNVTIARSDNAETANLNMQWLNGATIAGTNSAGLEGGLIRGTTGTLTLGNGTGTGANPSVVTVRGNHGTVTDTFNIGYAANTTESGVVKMKYANTSATAGNYFNIGWSNGGATAAALVSFKETTGGTEFAPLAGSGGVAVVGPLSGDVASFVSDVSVTTTGTVGFYNRGSNNVRGTLGNVVFQNDLSGVGTIEAGTVTFNGGSLSPGLSAGTLSIDGNLVLSSTTELNFELNSPGTVGNGVNDLIAVDGNLTLAGQINVLGAPESGTYTIMTYTGSLTTGAIVAPLGATLDLSQSGLVLLSITAVPEPASWMIVVGMIPMAIAVRRRRRVG